MKKMKTTILGLILVNSVFLNNQLEAKLESIAAPPQALAKKALKKNSKGTFLGFQSNGSRGVTPDWFNLTPAEGSEGIGTNEAYKKYGEPKSEIIVAVIDGGTDVTHEDLEGKIWVNKGEVPNDGIDNDKNGFIDDIVGWNFIGNSKGAAKFFPVNGSFANGIDYQAGDKKYQVGTDTLEVTRELKKFNNLIAQRTLTAAEKKEYDIVKAAYDRGNDNSGYYDLNSDTRKTIVGDNYSDLNEKNYGNNDVIGPDASHGTHVAGIISALRDNNQGTNGVASNVKIMTVRVVPDGDERDKDVANGIRYAVDMGAKVINMSFGKAFSPFKTHVDAAVKYALSKGVILVHAAGNDTKNNDTGRNFPNRFNLLDNSNGTVEFANWIEVGASASKKSSLAANFSNFGKKTVDLFAPGSNIYSSVPGNDYDYFSGTSMAAPVVAGSVAATWGFAPKAEFKKIREIIFSTVRLYPGLSVFFAGTSREFSSLSITGGVVDLPSAFKAAKTIGGTTTTPPTQVPPEAKLGWQKRIIKAKEVAKAKLLFLSVYI